MNIKLIFLVLVVSTISSTITSALLTLSLQPEVIAVEQISTTAPAVIIDENKGWAISRPDDTMMYEADSEVVVPAADLIKSGIPIEGISPEHQAILTKLDALYKEYKISYGAIRRCEKFFLGLPIEEQSFLCGYVTLNRKPTTEIKKLAEYLYQLRSKFVHEGELVLEIGGPIYVVTKKGLVHSSLTVSAVFRAFELGLLKHFRG